MRHSFKLRGLIIGAVLLLAAALSADTLVLRDGRRVEGQLISVQNGVVEFQEAGFGGQIGRLNRDDVVGIEFGRNENRETESPQRQEGRPRGLRERQTMAVANTPWTDTGLEVTSGQTVYFEASGEIVWGPNRRTGPSGEQNSPNNPARPISNRPGAALIGRIGNSKDYFYIGADQGAFRMRSSGRLFLGVNDDNLRDNSGYFRVMVYY